MTNRREFLQTGVAVSALPLAVHGFASHATASSGAQSAVLFHKVVFDDRYAEGIAFANEVSRYRVPVDALDDGDVTRVFEQCDLLWRDRPLPIAGFTQLGPQFVLERLANERGLRVVLRVEHQPRGDGTLAHVIAAPSATIALAEELRSERMEWPAVMATLVTHCRADRSAPERRTLVTPGIAPVLNAETKLESIIHYYTPHAIREGHPVPLDGPLCSWVIART